MRTKLVILSTCLLFINVTVSASEVTLHDTQPKIVLQTKIPGNPAVSFPVKLSSGLTATSDCNDIDLKVSKSPSIADKTIYTLTLKANNDVNFHLNMKEQLERLLL